MLLSLPGTLLQDSPGYNERQITMSARLQGPFLCIRLRPDLDSNTSSCLTLPPLVNLDSDTKLSQRTFFFLLNLTPSMVTQSSEHPSACKNSASAMKPRKPATDEIKHS